MAKPVPTDDNTPPNQGTFKDPNSPEAVIDSLQKRVEELLKVVEQRDKSIDKRNTIIQTMAQKIEENGIQFIVLSRNAYGLLTQQEGLE